MPNDHHHAKALERNPPSPQRCDRQAITFCPATDNSEPYYSISSLMGASRMDPMFRMTLLDTLVKNMRFLLHKPVFDCRLEYVHGRADTDVDGDIDLQLPKSIRGLFAEVATRLEFSWSLREEIKGPDTEVRVYFGSLLWDASAIAHVVRNKHTYETDSELATLWRGLFPLMEIGTGDMIAVPSDDEDRQGRVYYLSPNSPDCPVVEFEQSISDFLLTWAELACVNDVSLLQFRDPHTRRLSVANENALAWTRWLRQK